MKVERIGEKYRILEADEIECGLLNVYSSLVLLERIAKEKFKKDEITYGELYFALACVTDTKHQGTWMNEEVLKRVPENLLDAKIGKGNHILEVEASYSKPEEVHAIRHFQLLEGELGGCLIDLLS